MSWAESPSNWKENTTIPANIKFTDSLADSRTINWVSLKTSATTKIPNNGLLSLQWFLSGYLVCVTRRYLENKWHGLIYRQLKSNIRWFKEAEADYLTEPHQRLKFPKSYLIGATGRANFQKTGWRVRLTKKKKNELCN